MRHVLGMDWLGGYLTACHRVMFAAGKSMNLRCSLASDFGVSQLGLAGHRLSRHEAVVRSAMKLVGRRAERGMLDRLVKAEMELGSPACITIATAIFKITVDPRSGPGLTK